MAITCAHCGQALPRDNARFCNSCGAPVHPPPQHSQQRAARGPLAGEQSGGLLARPNLYEQIAQQPPSRPPSAGRSKPVGPPLNRLDQGMRTSKPPEKDEAPKQVYRSPRQESNPPDRVLHVRVWESKEPGDSSFSEEDTIFPDDSAVFPEDSIEDLPTALLEANIPKPPIQKPTGTAAPGGWDSHLDDVAQLSTSRLVSQRQGKPEEPLQQRGQPPIQMGGVGPAFQKPPMTPQLRPRSPFQAGQNISNFSPAQEAQQSGLLPTPLAPVSIVTKPVSQERRSRKRLGIVSVLLLILVAGGVATWIIVFQPFAVASITQPWQQFCDPGLGVSGQYPTGWMKQVDQKKAVRFSDGTDQFNIVTVAANGQDAGKYLQTEASQLGITGLKLGTPLSFAGASWQQAQGSLLQSQTGVTYTETLLVTQHGNRFFTITQVTPPGTYSEEDKTIFSGMRSSFQFSNSCP